MNTDELREELEAEGLVILHVGLHRNRPNLAMIFLHGEQGQWADGYALDIVKAVPGITAVAESVTTPTIILALMAEDELVL